MRDIIQVKKQVHLYEEKFEFAKAVDLLLEEWNKDKENEIVSMLLIGECFYILFFREFSSGDYGVRNDKNIDVGMMYDNLRKVYASGEISLRKSYLYKWYVGMLISTQSIVFRIAVPQMPEDEYIRSTEAAYMLNRNSQLVLSQWKLYNMRCEIPINRSLLIKELRQMQLQENMVDQELAWYYSTYNGLDISFEDMNVKTMK